MDGDKTLTNLPLPGPVSPLFIKRVLEANDELIKLAVTLQNETTTGSRSDLQK
jgi:aspartate aminotransferase-like enzyme